MVFKKLSLALVMLSTCSLYAGKVVVIKSEADLNDEVKNNTVTVVKFEAPWCGPCQAAKKPFNEVAKETKNPDVAFVVVDIDKQEALAKKYNVASIPTIVYFAHGKEVTRDTGMVSVGDLKSSLRAKVSQYAAGAPAGTEQAMVAEKEAPAPEQALAHVAEEPSIVHRLLGGITGFFISIVDAVKGVLAWVVAKIKGLF
jgi:thioredoxin 1